MAQSLNTPQTLSVLIQQEIGDIFIEATEVHGYSVDFWVPSKNQGIILFEDQHDHPDAYFGRNTAATKLRELGYDILLLWIEESNETWVRQHCTEKIRDFFNNQPSS